MFLQVVVSKSKGSLGCLPDLNTCCVQAPSLCLSKITRAHSVEGFSCQTPVSAGTKGSSEISSPAATPGTICIIPHSAWQAPKQLPSDPLQQFLGGHSSPLHYSAPIGDRGCAPHLWRRPSQKSPLGVQHTQVEDIIFSDNRFIHTL